MLLSNRFVINLCLLLIPCMFSGQEPLHKFEHIRVADGLINNTVNCFLEDSKGFVWIGTNDGLQRYDGQDFVTFQKSKGDIGLQSSIIKTIFEDTDGKLWIGTTDGGITLYAPDDNSYTSLTTDNSTIKNNDIYCVIQDSLKRVWLGTASGIELFDENYKLITDSLNRNRLPEALFADGIRSFFIDSKNRLLVGTEMGDLISLRADSLNYVVADESVVPENMDIEDLPSTAILAIEEDCFGNFWLATWNGLVSLQPQNRKAKRFFKHELNLPGQIVSSLEYTADDVLYVGTWGNGVFSFDVRTGKQHQWDYEPDNSDGLSYNDISCMMQTRDGNLWVGTNWEGGINIMQPNLSSFNHYKITGDDKGNDINIIQAFVEDADGNFYIGTRNGLCRALGNGQYEMLKVADMPGETINYPIRSLAYDSLRNSLWVGTDGYGLLNYDLDSKRVKWFRLCWKCKSSISNNAIWDIKIDRQGMVWLASWGGGIDKLDPSTGLFTNYAIDPHNFGQNVALSIDFDKNGMVWAATYGKGIARLDPASGTISFMLSNSKGSYKGNGMYYHIFVASNNTIWAASLSGGLIKINTEKESVKIFNRSNTNISNVIIAINEDSAHNIWACSEQELCRIDLYSRIETYSSENGIPESSFSIGASYRRKDGKLVFGNSDGFLLFDPQAVTNNRKKLNAEITEISLLDELVVPHRAYSGNVILSALPENTDKIKLKYFQNSLSFKFTAFDFISADKNTFAYKLEGFDDDWRYTDAASRKAAYTNLPSGKYRLLVSASPNGASWNTELRALDVVIEKAFWEQWWFYLLSVLALALAVAGVIRSRTIALRNKNRWLQEMVETRTSQIKMQNRQLSDKNNELYSQSVKINEYFQEVLAQKEEIKNQRDYLQLQHQDIKSSIDYAKLIQDATLPSNKYLSKLFENSFLIYWPRDVISGDFYWVAETKLTKVVVVADCTGHGVPGAFMSMLGISLLNEILNHGDIVHAGAVLDELRYKVIHSLNQKDANTVSKDGIDMAICVFEKGESRLNFAGANSALHVMRKSGELLTVKPDKMPVGYHHTRNYAFTNHQVDIGLGDRIYMMSDGWADQFGGPKGKKYKTAQVKKTIQELHLLSIHEHKKIIEHKITEWMKHSKGGVYENQVDDIIIMGIEVDEKML